MNENRLSLTGTLMIVFILAVIVLLAWAVYSGPQQDPTEPVTVNVQQSVNVQQFVMPTMAPMPTQAPAYAPINDAMSAPAAPGTGARLHNKTRRVSP